MAVDLEKLRTQFSRIEIEGEETESKEATNQMPTQATAVVKVSPRTREDNSCIVSDPSTYTSCANSCSPTALDSK